MDQKVDQFKIPENVASYSYGNHPERVLVIGSGFGGLAAAIRLALKGYEVQILERLGSAGGRAYVHRRHGFTFDAGPTIITAPFLLEELWEMCGKKMSDDVDLRAMDPFYQIRFSDGRIFNYTGDLERMKVEVAKFSPKDLPGYLRFLDEAENCYKLAFEDLGDVAFDSIKDLVQAMPNLIKMRAWNSLYSLVAKYIKDPQLREVMSFHPLLIGGNPFSVSSAYALINSLERKWGVHSAMGGTGAIIKGLVGLLEGLGVSIRYASTVKKINIVDNKVTGVTLENGDVLYSNMVVSNADTAWTYKNLIDPAYRKVWTDKKIENGDYSMSLFVWYFGTKKK